MQNFSQIMQNWWSFWHTNKQETNKKRNTVLPYTRMPILPLQARGWNVRFLFPVLLTDQWWRWTTDQPVRWPAGGHPVRITVSPAISSIPAPSDPSRPRHNNVMEKQWLRTDGCQFLSCVGNMAEPQNCYVVVMDRYKSPGCHRSLMSGSGYVYVSHCGVI